MGDVGADGGADGGGVSTRFPVEILSNKSLRLRTLAALLARRSSWECSLSSELGVSVSRVVEEGVESMQSESNLGEELGKK